MGSETTWPEKREVQQATVGELDKVKKNDTLQGTSRRGEEVRRGGEGEKFLTLSSLDQLLIAREQTQVPKVSAATGVRGVQLVQG